VKMWNAVRGHVIILGRNKTHSNISHWREIG
jgi:hypothetical protein